MDTKALTVEVAKEDSHPVQNGTTTTRDSTVNSIEQSLQLDSQPLQNDAISNSEPSTMDSQRVASHSSVLKFNTLRTGCYSNTHCEDDHSGDIHDQQEDISKSVNDTNVSDDTTRPIIITGFGRISRDESGNLSADVMQDFYQRTNGGKLSYNSEQIPVLTGCPDMMKDPNNLQPIETSYRFVTTPLFNPWLQSTNARLAIHLGTKDDISGNEIWFELQACNGGAGFWATDDYSPDGYSEECILGGSQYLQTSFDIPTLIKKVNERVSNGTDLKFSFKESNDAGNSLCNFLYYRSLYYADQRGNDAQNVIFIHIPPAYNLSSNVTATDFASVLEQIVYCLLDMCTSESDQQEIVSYPLKQTPTVFKNAIVVTGFDPIYDPQIPNQSWIIVQKFCSQFQQKGGLIEHNSIPFQLMTGPPDCPNQPIKTTYSYVTSQDFNNWLQSSNALLYIHVGVDSTLNSQSGNVFSFTMVAANGYDGYWGADKNFYTFPGPCVKNGDKYLYTQFSDEQLSSVVSRLPDEVKINGAFTFQQMTNNRQCGRFLCNLLRYTEKPS